MNLTLCLIVLAIIIVCNVCIFAIIYHQIDTPELPGWDDAFYLSIQVQTCIGMSEIPAKNVRNLITLQSIIAYITNISIAVLIGLLIVIKYKQDLKINGNYPVTLNVKPL